jgi:MbtH protein
MSVAVIRKEELTMDQAKFDVVLNDEEQYSIWQSGREIPAGWRQSGFNGTREACLAHIEQVWKDITPKSVRERLASDDQ